MQSHLDTAHPGAPERKVVSSVAARRVSALPLLGYGLIFSLAALLGAGGGKTAQAFANCGQIVAAGAGALACFVAFRRGQAWHIRTRWAWAIISLALLCHGLGRLAYAYTEQIQGITAPFPSVGDFWWVLERPLLCVALVLLAQPGRPRQAVRVLFDALIVVLAALVLTWTMLMGPLLTDPEASLLQRALSLFYPLADITVLFCLIFMAATARARPGFARTVEFLLLGVLATIVSRSLHLWQIVRDSDVTSSLVDIGWVWGSLLIGAAALAQIGVADVSDGTTGPASEVDLEKQDTQVEGAPAAEYGDLRLLRWRRMLMLWLPSVAAMCVSTVFFVRETLAGNSEEMQRWTPLLVLMLAIMARQMVTLSDNLRLNERLGAVNEDLERNVTERTRHLATLHGITSTLNTSLNQQAVLRATLEETMAAVGADSGGVWLRAVDNGTTMDLRGRGAEAPSEPRWEPVHSAGFEGHEDKEQALYDLAIAVAEERRVLQSMVATLLPEGELGTGRQGLAAVPQNYIVLPIRWQGTLLGAVGLLRLQGAFKWEDRALVESVALEAGAALQNARLYHDASRRADRDSVTDLLNHRAIQQQLNGCLVHSRINSTEFGVVVMDLNNFKFFNDTYGHIVGDEVLRAVADCLREGCRASDILGRFGGDEFIALLPDTDSEGAADVCGRIAALLGERHFEAAPDLRVPITMSFGWAVFPHDGETALELLGRADAELYEHKRGAKDYTPQRRDAAAGREETRKLKNSSWSGSFGVLDALVTAIDNKDHYTRHHSEEVTRFALMVAKEIGYSEQGMRAVRISGLLHDVGKIAVPDAILRHPGRLGPEESRIMRQHPVLGALIVKDLPHLDQVLDGIRYHHERWDGKGYPEGLVGTAIPAMGRLLAVADCYSAMTTDRPYRKAFSPEEALEEIEKQEAAQFDPAIANVFVRVMRRELTAPSPGLEEAMPSLSTSLGTTNLVGNGA